MLKIYKARGGSFGMTLREQKKEDTRRRILEVADELFRSKGFDETHVAEIASRVRISEKTVFNYFQNKEAILSELALGWFQQYELLGSANDETVGVKSLSEWKDEIRTRLRVVERARAFMSMVVLHTNLLQSYYGKEKGEESESFATALLKDAAKKADMFRTAQRKGLIRKDVPPEELVVYYNAIRSAIVTDWLTREDSEFGELEERVLRAVDVLLMGMRAQDDSHDRDPFTD